MTSKFAASIVLAGLLGLTHADQKHKDFLGFAAKNNKHYKNTAEMDYRFEKWNETDDFICEHKNKGKRGAKLAHNSLSDWSQAEKESLLGAVPSKLSQQEVEEKKQDMKEKKEKKIKILIEKEKKEKILIEKEKKEKKIKILIEDPDSDSDSDGDSSDDGEGRELARKIKTSCRKTWWYLYNGRCLACPDTCATCTDSTTCTACYGNLSVLDSGLCGCPNGYLSGGNCIDCAADQYFNGNTCVSCGSNCSQCSSSGTCLACEDASFNLTNGSCVCPSGQVDMGGYCAECSAGTYFSNGTCVGCTENGCLECSSGNTCTKCDDSAKFEMNPVNGDCVCQANTVPINTGTGCGTCESNQFIANDVCNDCPTGCASCSGAGQCDACENAGSWVAAADGSCGCPNNLFWNGTECTESQQCQSDEFNNGTACQQCPGGCTSCADLTGNCLNCSSPFVDDNGDGVCECPAGQSAFIQDGTFVDCVDAFNAKRVFAPYPSNATLVDWRDQGVVGSVENQGQCGSCATFAVGAAVESNHAIKTGELINASNAYILECMPEYCPSDWGFWSPCHYFCDGAWPGHLLKFASVYGVPTEADYPYTSYQRGGSYNSCQDNGSMAKPIDSMVGSGSIFTCMSVDQCKAALQIGTLTVDFYVENWFYSYSSGVVDKDACAVNNSINHAMQAVGYGTLSDGATYIIIKNSWGTGWGDNGYFKIEMSDSSAYQYGVCGLFYDNYLPDHDLF